MKANLRLSLFHVKHFSLRPFHKFTRRKRAVCESRLENCAFEPVDFVLSLGELPRNKFQVCHCEKSCPNFFLYFQVVKIDDINGRIDLFKIVVIVG
jgi:hypothetical protein